MAHAWGRFSRDGIIGIQSNEATLSAICTDYSAEAMR